MMEMQHDMICFGFDSLTLYDPLRHIYTNFSNAKVILKNVNATITAFLNQNI